ncbi:MAG: HAD hydrolase-like protein, partial [Candidatus Omnitrophota bacterium]|nr:HAD hydrolase-like protein [Candidatus Omnitrophota bacterium]
MVSGMELNRLTAQVRDLALTSVVDGIYGSPAMPEQAAALPSNKSGYIKEVLRSTGISADKAIMVGDTKQDMASAREAGVIPVGRAESPEKESELRSAGALATIRDYSAGDKVREEIGRLLIERAKVKPAPQVTKPKVPAPAPSAEEVMRRKYLQRYHALKTFAEMQVWGRLIQQGGHPEITKDNFIKQIVDPIIGKLNSPVTDIPLAESKILLLEVTGLMFSRDGHVTVSRKLGRSDVLTKAGLEKAAKRVQDEIKKRISREAPHAFQAKDALIASSYFVIGGLFMALMAWLQTISGGTIFTNPYLSAGWLVTYTAGLITLGTWYFTWGLVTFQALFKEYHGANTFFRSLWSALRYKNYNSIRIWFTSLKPAWRASIGNANIQYKGAVKEILERYQKRLAELKIEHAGDRWYTEEDIQNEAISFAAEVFWTEEFKKYQGIWYPLMPEEARAFTRLLVSQKFSTSPLHLLNKWATKIITHESSQEYLKNVLRMPVVKYIARTQSFQHFWGMLTPAPIVGAIFRNPLMSTAVGFVLYALLQHFFGAHAATGIG